MNTNNPFQNNGMLGSNGSHQFGNGPQMMRPSNGMVNGQPGFLNQQPMSNMQLNRQQVQAQAFPPNKMMMQQQQNVLPSHLGLRSQTPNAMMRQPTTETCHKHQDINVAFNEKTKEVLCNQCIFERKVAELKFTAIVVKELKDKFQKEFEKYRESMSLIGQTNPDLVRQQVKIMIAEFFGQLKFKVRDLQKSVMEQIKNSENIKNLEKTLEQSKEFLQANPAVPDHFEKEKKIFDEKITKGRYAFLVKRREFYNSLIESLDKSRQKINQTIDQSIQYQERILKVNNDDKVIHDKLNEIMMDCINIDCSQVEPGQGLKLNKQILQQPPQQQQQQFAQQNKMNGVPQQQPQLQRSLTQPLPSQQQLQQPIQHQSPVKTIPVITQIQSPQTQQVMQNSPIQSQQILQQQIVQNSPLSNQGGPQNISFSNQVQQQQRPVQQLNQVPPTVLNMQAGQVQMQRPSNAFNNIQQPIVQQQQASVTLHQIQQAAQRQQQQQQNDEVLITGTNIQPLPELEYKTCFKLKSMNLLKLYPDQGWQKFQDHPQVFMAKCVFTPDEVVYLIGGARDQRTKETLNDVQSSQLINGSVVIKHKAKMNNSRASFGCVYSLPRNEIFVAGGYTLGELTKKCEVYSIQNDRWTNLPDLNETKCSQSLCVLDGRYLYSFGGLQKVDQSIQLNTTIERLDLSMGQGWQLVQLKLNEPACDIGVIPISKDEILLFGGWNKSAINGAYIMKRSETNVNGQKTEKHDLRVIDKGLGEGKSDFFLTTGVGMKGKNPYEVKVCGHAQLFTFDLKERKFIGTSSV